MQKELAIDAMFAACIVNTVKARNRTTDAAHLEFQKYPDRLGRSAHDVVDQVLEANGHGSSSMEAQDSAVRRRFFVGGQTCQDLYRAAVELLSAIQMRIERGRDAADQKA
jgi:hypothetical protein